MKQIYIAKAVVVKEFDEQIQVTLQLNREVGLELSMAFLLLKEQLVSSIGIKFPNFLLIFKIGSNRHSYCDSLEMKSRIFKGRISSNGIDYILHYILKFYRDGFAEAEHIDLDFISDSKSGFTLTISCSDYKEYSDDEIRKMLE